MNYSKLSKILGFSFALTLVLGLNAIAQQGLPQQAQPEINENFSEKEYEDFVKINLELIPIQEGMQEEMVAAIEDSGLNVERFQQLAQAQQTGKLKEVSKDPAEMAKFNEAGQQVMQMQQDVQTKVMEVIQKSDLPEEKFQEMYMAYNQSEKVRSKIDSMIEKESEN